MLPVLKGCFRNRASLAATFEMQRVPCMPLAQPLYHVGMGVNSAPSGQWVVRATDSMYQRRARPKQEQLSCHLN